MRTDGGMTVHTWQHPAPQAAPVVLVHGFGSSALYNWVRTGWVAALQRGGRTVVAVDLPGHGDSAAVDPRGLRIEDLTADLTVQLGLLAEAADGPVELHGYSLGSRLSWELGAAQPELVSSLVVGGSTASDRLAGLHAEQARHWCRTGELPADPLTRAVVPMAAALPGQDPRHAVELLLSLAREPFVPSAAVPEVDTLVVAGEQDRIAADAHQLADLVRGTGADARFVPIPGRNHVNVLTAQDYKRAVEEFLTR